MDSDDTRNNGDNPTDGDRHFTVEPTTDRRGDSTQQLGDDDIVAEEAVDSTGEQLLQPEQDDAGGPDPELLIEPADAAVPDDAEAGPSIDAMRMPTPDELLGTAPRTANATEDPADFAITEQPAEFVATEQPAEFVVTEDPAEFVATEQPAELVAEPPATNLETEQAGTQIWFGSRDFFVREANTLAVQQPERAALMWVCASEVGLRTGEPLDQTLADVDQALQLRPHAGWLLTRARRTMMECRRYTEALELAEREVRAGGDASARASVLYEASGVVLYERGNLADALKCSERALKVQPHHVGALLRTATLRSSLGRHAETARALQQIGEYLGDPRQRAQFLYAAATIHETKLGQDEAAQSAYLRAIEADPQHIPSLLSLCDLLERTQQWTALCRTLEQLAGIVTTPEVQARLWHWAGALHFDCTGNLEAACRLLMRAAQAAPKDTTLLQRLVHAFEAKGAHQETVQTLRRLLDLTHDRQGRAALWTHVATICQDQLQDDDGAAEAYRAALKEVPGYLPALQSLATLYRQREDFESLIEVASPEAESMLPAEARAVRYVELAEVLAERLNRPDEAVEAYRRAIDLVPNMHQAYWGWTALMRNHGRYRELAEALARHAEVCADEATTTYLLLERARMLAGPLHDSDRAVETLGRAEGAREGRTIALTLLELLERSQRHAELVEHLIQQAEATSDPTEAEARRIVAAQLLELHLDEPDKALEVYRAVLADNPHSMAAVHGAGRLLYRKSAWTELVKLHHHELTHHPNRPDTSSMLCRVGRVLAEKLGHLPAAIDAYSKALSVDPSCTPALVALEWLVRSAQQWPQLVRVLEHHARARENNASGALALCRAGEVAAWQLDDLDEARRLFEAALQYAETSIARRGLLRVLLQQEDWTAAADLLPSMIETAPTADDQAHLTFTLARIKEFRLGEEPDYELYRRAAAGPHGGSLSQELTRIRRHSRAADLGNWLTELSSQTADDALAAAQLLEAVQIYEFVTKDPAALGQAAAAALERNADDLATIWCLERAYLAGRQWHALAQLCEKEAQLELDRPARAQHLARAAAAYEQAAAMGDAKRVCRECLNFDAHCLPALITLARLSEQDQQWNDLAELCDRIAEACNHAENRLAYCLKAAKLWDLNVGDPSRALASLSVALTDTPDQVDAFEHAASLLQQRDDSDELSGLYQRAIRSCADDARKVELLRRHARLLKHREHGRHHADRAISEYSALLAIEPNDIAALQELAELHANQHHWSDAAATLGLMIERADDAEVRHEARLQQAELWLERLHEPDRARAVLETAGNEHAEDQRIAELTLRLGVTVGDWNTARDVLERMSHADDRRTRMWAVLQLNDIAQQGLDDAELQQSCEIQALREAACDTKSLADLRRHYRASSDRLRLLATTEALVDQAGEGPTKDGLRRLLVHLALEDVALPERAEPHLKHLRKTHPDDPLVLSWVGRSLEQQGKVNKAAKHYRVLLHADASNVAAYRGLARVGSVDTAKAAAAIVSLLAHPNPEESLHLESLGGETVPQSPFAAEPPQPEERLQPLKELLEALSPHLVEVFGTPDGSSLADNHPAADNVTKLAHALGVGPIQVRLAETGSARVGLGTPLTLQLDDKLAEQPATPEFRFWVGHALARAQGGGAVLQQLTEEELDQLFEALRERRAHTPEAQRLSKTLTRILPRKLKRHLIQLAPRAREPELRARYRHKLESWADRLAMVLCRHPGIAVAELARQAGLQPAAAAQDPHLAELMQFAVSDDYAKLYRTVWR